MKRVVTASRCKHADALQARLSSETLQVRTEMATPLADPVTCATSCCGGACAKCVFVESAVHRVSTDVPLAFGTGDIAETTGTFGGVMVVW